MPRRRIFKSCSVKMPAIIIYFMIMAIQTSSCTSKHYLYYRSVLDLQDIESFEFNFVTDLSRIANLSSFVPKNIQSRYLELYLKDYYTTYAHMKTEILESLSQKEEVRASANPLGSYRLIWRVKQFMLNLVSYKSLEGSLRQQLLLFFWRRGWLSYVDVEMAIKKILAIQQIYDLNADELAVGWIMEKATNFGLNSEHRYHIAIRAMQAEQHFAAITWLELAKEKARDDKMSSFLFVECALQNAIQEHNDLEVLSRENLDERFFNRKIRSYVPQDYKRVQKLGNIRYNTFKEQKGKSYQKTNFYGLCSGGNLQTEKDKSHLFCWYEFKTHPILAIGPTKMELLSRNPDIVQVYEFFSFTETIGLKESAIETLKSPKFDYTGAKKFHSNTITKVILPGSGNDVALKTKMNRITGLGLRNLKGMKPLAVESHPSGGHLFPRIEKDAKNAKNGGVDLTASLVVNLNDVEAGGDIAFTSMGVAAKPTRGSAVFWYNQLQDGSIDVDTVHMACPVLLGEKWVAKKLINLDDRFLLQNCGLMKTGRFRFPINNVYLEDSFKLDTAPAKTETTKPLKPESGSPFVKYSAISPFGLQTLLQLEWKLYPRIKQLYFKYRNRTKGGDLEGFKTHHQDIRMYLQDFEDSTKNLVESLENLRAHNLETVRETALNPMVMFKMVGRFRDYLQPWVEKLQSHDSILFARIATFISKFYNVDHGPLNDDYEKVTLGVVKLQFIYDVPVQNVSNGYLVGAETKIKLNAKDCFRIGRIGVQNGFFVDGIEWLTHALHLSQTHPENSLNQDELYNAIAVSEILHDEAFSIKSVPGYYLYQNPISQTPELSQRVKMRSLSYNISNLETDQLNSVLFDICSGKIQQADEYKAKLFCWYEREIHPVYKIGPIKAEIHSVRPYPEVVQFYDILKNQTILDSFKKFIQEHAHRVFLWGEKFDPLKSEVVRALDFDIESSEATNFIKLLERTTGFKLSRKEGEPIYYFAYPPGTARGRHYDTHSFIKERLFSSIIVYLSDVAQGGETVFPRFKLKVSPIKGSMIFWHNFHSCGALDEISEHASCPIVFGEKYIFAKDTIESEQQDFHCSLKPQSPYEILVNGKSKYV